jgi:tetratricopeptide (TPR) repeat protein
MKHISLLLLAFSLVLAACTGTQEPEDHMIPPDAGRQAELTRLYDRMGSETESIGVSAAQSAAAGDERDHRYMASLWGTRKKSAIGARRLGAALSKAGHHQQAFDWFERAYMHVDSTDELAPWLRYEMASEYHALGRNEDCINLLANRMGTQPLSRDLKSKYDDLIAKASRG